MNEEDLKKLQKKFNELTETSKKYSNQGYVKSNNIIFRKPQDEIEEEFVKRVNLKHFLFIIIFAIIFLLCFICSIIMDSKVIIKIILGLITLLCGYLSINSIRTNELMIGKAIYKERKRNSSKKSRSYNYFVTVIDEENKLIYTKIQITKKEYDLVEEGTTILISKGSRKGYIYE